MQLLVAEDNKIKMVELHFEVQPFFVNLIFIVAVFCDNILNLFSNSV